MLITEYSFVEMREQDLYYEDLAGRSRIAERLNDSLSAPPLSPFEEKQLRWVLARAYGYIDGRTPLNLQEALEQYDLFIQVPDISKEDIALAKIEMANLYRLMDRCDKAKPLLAEASKIPHPLVQMMELWVSAALRQDRLDSYSEYTYMALSYAEKVAPECVTIVVADRVACLQVWRFYQLYRTAMELKLQNPSASLDHQIALCWEWYKIALDDCRGLGLLTRLTDVLTHRSVFQAYVTGEAESAWEAITIAKLICPEGYSNIPAFREQVEAMLSIRGGIDVFVGALDLGSRIPNRAWLFLLVARELARQEFCEKDTADSPVVYPPAFYSMDVPDEIRPGVERLLREFKKSDKVPA